MENLNAKYREKWIDGIRGEEATSDDVVKVGVVDADKHTMRFESLPVIVPFDFDDALLYKKPKSRFTRVKRRHKKGRRK